MFSEVNIKMWRQKLFLLVVVLYPQEVALYRGPMKLKQYAIVQLVGDIMEEAHVGNEKVEISIHKSQVLEIESLS